MLNIKSYTLPQAQKAIFKNVEVLDSLQRRIAFKHENKVNFIRSLLTKNVRTAIVVADIAKCLEHVKLPQNYCEKSIKTFESLISQGYHYLSIDGQNRTESLKDFLDNKVAVCNVVYDAGGESEPVPIETPTCYKNLPTGPKAFLDHSDCIYVDVIEDQSIDQLHDTYLALNSGVPHNMMERINATVSQPAEVIRDLAKPYEAMWLSVSKLEHSRMDDLKYTAQAVLMCMGDEIDSNSADPTTIEKLYNLDGFDHVSQQDVNMIKKIFFDMSIGISQYCTGSNKKLTLSQWWSLFMAIHAVHSRGTPIWIDRKAFTARVIEKVIDFIDDAKVDRGDHMKEYHAGKRTQKPSRTQYFDGWISAFHMAAMRRQAYNQIDSFVGVITHAPTYLTFQEDQEEEA